MTIQTTAPTQLSFLKTQTQQLFYEPKVKVNQLFHSPKTIQLFAEPKVNNLLYEPKVNNLFYQPKVNQLFYEPKVNQLFYQPQQYKLKYNTLKEQIKASPKIVNVRPPTPYGIIGSSYGGFDFGFPYIPKGELGGGPKKRKGQRGKQKTRYQTSLTGSILGIKGTGLLPGALSVRGILEPTNKKKNKIL